MSPISVSLWLLLTCVLDSVFVTSATGIQYTKEIQIQSGKLRGFVETLPTTNAKVQKYLGIPYAKAKRFEKPVAPKPWTSVKNMTSFGKICWQSLSGNLTWSDMSEDCLNLNIFAPLSSSKTSLPVMVWIHGGTFLFNSNRVDDGSYLASEGGVMVVVINYRLDQFGFLASKDFNMLGNYGLYDQIQALKWVKNNIKKFGGDPTKVTVSGNSAGGTSVALLSISPEARGLFQRAIVQSGPPVFDMLIRPYTDKKTFKKHAKKYNCTVEATMKTCLQSLSAKKLIDPFADLGFMVPVIDGAVITEDPRTWINKKISLNPSDIIIGVSSDDGSCTSKAIPVLSPGLFPADLKSYSRKGYLSNLNIVGKYLMLNFGNANFDAALYQALKYQYTDRPDTNSPARNRRLLHDALTDGAFLAQSVAFAKAVSNAYKGSGSSGKTFFYINDHSPQLKMAKFILPTWLKGYHESTKFLALGVSVRDNVKAEDVQLSREVIKMWSNFAKTGDPNNPTNTKITWPVYDSANQNYLAIKTILEVKSKPRLDYVAFWNELLPALNKTIPDPCPPQPAKVPLPSSITQPKKQQQRRLHL